MKHLIHTNSNTITNENTAKLPSASRLMYGELAVNYADGYETLAIKNDANEIVTFPSKTTVMTMISDSEYIGKSADNGFFIPQTNTHSTVGQNSLLITEATGVTLGRKALSITTGFNWSATKINSTTWRLTFDTNMEGANPMLEQVYLLNGAMVTQSEATSSDYTKIAYVNEIYILDSSQSQQVLFNPQTTDIYNLNFTAKYAKITVTKELPSLGRIYPKQPCFSTLLFGAAGCRDSSNGYSVVGGQICYNDSNASVVSGTKSVNRANSSVVCGRSNYNSGFNSTIFGIGNINTYRNRTVIGKYSENVSSLFSIGCGASSSNRKNIVNVTETQLSVNGDVQSETVTITNAPTNNNHAITKSYAESNFAALTVVSSTLILTNSSVTLSNLTVDSKLTQIVLTINSDTNTYLQHYTTTPFRLSDVIPSSGDTAKLYYTVATETTQVITLRLDLQNTNGTTASAVITVI